MTAARCCSPGIKRSTRPEIPGRGNNVVFHEFAHKLDMRDDIVDGTPRFDRRGDLDRWVEVCTEAYEALRAGEDRPPLQPYGATNPAEFFAVATEAFFDVPELLEQHEPEPLRGHARLMEHPRRAPFASRRSAAPGIREPIVEPTRRADRAVRLDDGRELGRVSRRA